MKTILGWLHSYRRQLSPLPFLLVCLFTAGAVWINYAWGLEPALMHLQTPQRLAAWYGLFLLAFGLPWLLTPFVQQGGWRKAPGFLPLLLAAPAVFSLKLALPLPTLVQGPDAAYWKIILYYPTKLLLTLLLVALLWRLFDRRQPFYGAAAGESSLRPYMLMLLIMMPLIALASTQPDFLRIYPKWMHLTPVRTAGPFRQFLYELSYGSDFFTIELFFRGFLVLAFARFGGPSAILPMAVFYCFIHFGKPLGECISSFFGGILLGVITLHTRSIRGGLIVHLGIAWLMELGGWLAHLWR